MSALRIVFWVIAGIVLGVLFGLFQVTSTGATLGIDVPGTVIRGAAIHYGAIGAAIGAVVGPLVIIATKQNDQ